MKKTILCLLVIVVLFTLTGCGSEKKEEEEQNSLHPNQTGYVEGKYFIDDLTFNLYEGFEPASIENVYQLINDTDGISIYFYHDKDIKTSLGEFINSDPHYFLPNRKNLEEAIINGNSWYKGTTNDNAYLYYIQVGNDVYSIMIMPIFTSKTVLNGTISTLENSLYFK